MDTASVTLVLQKLETAMTVARTMMTSAQTSGAPDAKLAELLATLTMIESEMQAMQQMLGEASGEISDLTLPGKVSRRSESPYYWEDD